MTAQVFNTDLAIKVLVEIEKAVRGLRTDGLSWDQMDYRESSSCGTSYCFAGWAVHLSGVESLIYSVSAPGGLGASWSTWANHLLGAKGWDDEDCESGLYSPMNTLDDLYAYCAKFADLTVAELHGKVDAEGGWAA